MKKIFAIALALVMVLSMASAFASYCTGGFDWTCATDATYCGQGKVEVVPFVKVNNSCGGYTWQVSECASAVNSEKVYYAVMLTVAPNADKEWWTGAGLKIEGTGVAAKELDAKNLWGSPDIDWEEDEDTLSYYLKNDFSKWVDVEDWEDFETVLEQNAYIFEAEVTKASKAKVCATLTSADAGQDGIVGNYWVEYEENVSYEFADSAVVAKLLEKGLYDVYKAGKPNPNDYMTKPHWGVNPVVDEAKYNAAVEAYEEAVALVSRLTVTTDVVDLLSVYTKDPADGGKLLVTYTMVDGKVAAIDYTAICGEAAYATIKAFFGLEIGTCVDADLIEANFGWDDEQESCFSWSDKAASIVDAECVVAIPKTGDASVLAWLF